VTTWKGVKYTQVHKEIDRKENERERYKDRKDQRRKDSSYDTNVQIDRNYIKVKIE